MATATRDAADLLPGSRWRALRGDHAGAVVEILGVNKAGRVRFANAGTGEGRNVGNGHFDPAVKNLKSADWFLSTYTLAMPAPTARTETDTRPAAVPTQPAFRQPTRVRPPKPGPTPPSVVSPAEGLIDTRNAKFNVSLELISPDRARQWLDRGGLNRKLNEQRVGILAAAIRRGEWQITGDSIKLDASGRVRDGQHRLAAIAISQAVQSLVVFGVAESAFDVMDTGRSRSIADVVGMRGYADRNSLSAAVRSLIMIETVGRLESGTNEARGHVTSATTLAYLRDHPDVEPALRRAEALRKEVAGSPGLWAALLVLFGRLNPAATEMFEEAMMTGAGLDKGSPLLVLRNRLTGNSVYWSIQNRGDRENLAATIIKAWNAWRKNETMDSWRNLSWRSSGRSAEPFPMPQ